MPNYLLLFLYIYPTKPALLHPEPATPIVTLQNASIHLEQQTILSNIDLTINPGEFVFLIGKTGSGKTSLLKALYGAAPLKASVAKVGDFHLNQLSFRDLPRLRRSLGIIFQDFKLLYDRSVYDNLFFVLKATGWRRRKIKERIDDVLSAVHLSEKKDQMPLLLSGGEQQKAVIARAIINHPKLIIADEPTGNLDPETSKEILDLIRLTAEQNQAAVIFATHDMSLIDHFPARIIICEGGSVHEK